MRQTDIRPAVLRDASWLMANLRPLDHAEAFCQLEPGYKTHELAHYSLSYGESFIAYDRDQPAMLFGTAPINICCLSVWALGTKRAWRVAKQVSDWLRDAHLPALAAKGYTSMEARSLLEHEAAHRWIEATGGVRHGPPFVFGRNGERFQLFRWTSDQLGGIQLPQHEEIAA